MKLFVIMVCLLSEWFLIHSVSYQRFAWFERYYLFIRHTMDKYTIPRHAASVLLFVVLPILLIVGLVYLLLASILFGLLGLIVNLVIFYYCIGPQNPFYPVNDVTVNSLNDVHVGSYLAQVNNQLFAPIFWYIIGGPIAVLAFRLISLLQTSDTAGLLARTITEILEWIPARLTVLLYLLVGNFQAGFKRFTHYMIAQPNLNKQMLSECGLLAIRSNNEEEIPMSTAEQLVEHAVIVLLVLLSLFTLVAWL